MSRLLYVVLIASVGFAPAQVAAAQQSPPAGKQAQRAGKEGKQKCSDCVAASYPGADTLKQSYCTTPSRCRNGDENLLFTLANAQCAAGNADNCAAGSCPGTSRCTGIHDRRNSVGLTVTAAPAAVNTCKNPREILCDVTLTIAAGGQLACKCSCNPR